MPRKNFIIVLFLSAFMGLAAQPICKVALYDENSGLSQGHVTRIIQDRRGMIWLSTWNGLNRYDGYEFKCFKSHVGDGSNMPSDRFRNIELDKHGNLLCAVDETAILFDVKRQKFFSLPTSVQKTLAKKLLTKKHPSSNKDKVYDYTDAYGTRWLIKPTGEMFCREKGSKTFVKYTDGNKDFRDFNGEFIDRQGNLWFRGRLGAFKLTFNKHRIHDIEPAANSEIRCIYKEKDGHYWVSERDGALRLYDASNKLVGYLNNNGQLGRVYTKFNISIYSMFRDSKGTLWIGSKPAGLFRLHGRLELVANGLWVYDIKEDSYGHLWIATMNNGLKMIPNPAANKPDLFNIKEPCKRIRNLLITHDNHLLAATTEGLLVTKLIPDVRNMKFIRHHRENNRAASLNNNATMNLLEDHQGRIFVCTESGGVNMIIPDRATDTNKSPYSNLMKEQLDFKHFDLSSDVIESMIEINRELWVVAVNKIIHLNPNNGASDDYDMQFFGRAYKFSECRPTVLPDGRWMFATTDGAFTVSPGEMRRNGYVPPIVITDISIENKDTIVAGDTLTLNPMQRNVTISFAALDYTQEPNMHYAFRFAGEENAWNYIHQQHSATFLNMSPGTYVLEIRSTNAYGQWTNNMKRLTIIVEPKFTETLFAHVLISFLLVLLAILIVYTYLYIRHIKLKQEEIMEAYLKLLDKHQASEAASPVPADAQNPDTEERTFYTSLSSENDAFMKRVMSFVDEHISDDNVNIDDMASAAATSKSGLNRKMKSLTGVTPMDFLARARMKKAQQLLSDTDLTIFEVADKCGYYDPKYFSKVFKRTTGKSPSDYKSNRRNH